MPLRTGGEAEPRTGVTLINRGGPGSLPSGGPSGLVASTSTQNLTAIANTAVETAFVKTYTFPPGALDLPGGILMVNASGYYSSVGTPTLQFGVRIDTGVNKIFDCVPITTTNNAGNEFWALVCRAQLQPGPGNPQITLWPGYGEAALLSSRASNIAPGNTLLRVAAPLIDVTATWSAADPGNTIRLTTLEVWLFAPQVLL